MRTFTRETTMRLQTLPDAGLLLSAGGHTLLQDPWALRPAAHAILPEDPRLAEARAEGLPAAPDALYVTRVPADLDPASDPVFLELSRETLVLVPRDTHPRLLRGFRALGFARVEEIGHGETRALGGGVLTSYQSFPFTDSAVVVEHGGTALCSLLDSRFLRGPLAEMAARHPRFDIRVRAQADGHLFAETEVRKGAAAATRDLAVGEGWSGAEGFLPARDTVAFVAAESEARLRRYAEERAPILTAFQAWAAKAAKAQQDRKAAKPVAFPERAARWVPPKAAA